eukprot:SAG11_NODE_928_length_6510_cov_5.490251_3_plen_142_part_00
MVGTLTPTNNPSPKNKNKSDKDLDFTSSEEENAASGQENADKCASGAKQNEECVQRLMTELQQNLDHETRDYSSSSDDDSCDIDKAQEPLSSLLPELSSSDDSSAQDSFSMVSQNAMAHHSSAQMDGGSSAQAADVRASSL